MKINKHPLLLVIFTLYHFTMCNISYGSNDEEETYLFSDEGFNNDETLIPKYNPHDQSHCAEAFVLDLDGTVYQPDGLIPGAKEFFEYLEKDSIPYVLLSNTGVKSFKGTQGKLNTEPFKISNNLIDESRIRTAAEAQADYMIENVPPYSKIFVVSGAGRFWEDLLKERNLSLYQTWDVRTYLSVEEATEWAVIASRYREDCDIHSTKVVVAFFIDGEVKDMDYSGWSYSLLRVCSFLVNHKAYFVYTADDPYNPSVNAKLPSYVFANPGPGMFAAALRPAMHPDAEQEGRILCCGKGGNMGEKYMLDKAIEKLYEQGYTGPREKIMIVGDRYITDIRAGNRSKISSCLVESGCNKISELEYYKDDRPTFWSPCLGFLSPYINEDEINFENQTIKKSPSLLEHIANLPPANLLKFWLINSDKDNSDSLLRAYYDKIISAKMYQKNTIFNLKDLDSACEILEIKSRDACKLIRNNQTFLSQDQFVSLIKQLAI